MATMWGPLSTLQPTQLEKDQSEALEVVLRTNKCYESQNEAILREEVLGRLDSLVKEWVQKVTRAKVRMKIRGHGEHNCSPLQVVTKEQNSVYESIVLMNFHEACICIHFFGIVSCKR